MRLPSIAAPCFAVLSVFLCGCVATTQNIDDISWQIDALNRSVDNLRKNQQELDTRIIALSKKLDAHAQGLSDSGLQISRISAKIDDIDASLNGQFEALGKSIGEDKQRQLNIMLPSKIYSEAYSALMRGELDNAEDGFKSYLDKFPDGEMTESVYYHLGDVYAGKNNWQRSATNYALVLEKYKSSRYTPSARLKYAKALLEMKDSFKKKEAINYLKSIPQDFPKSEEGLVAKELLDTLIEKPKPAKKPVSAKKSPTANKAGLAPIKLPTAKKASYETVKK